MLRRTPLLNKVSTVNVALNSGKSLRYTPSYRPTVDFELARRYKLVEEKNRYDSLEILFGDGKLCGYVGRRQYLMQNRDQFGEKVITACKMEGMDWHDLKSLGRSALLDFADFMRLNEAEKIIFYAAIESKACGVLTKCGKDRRPGMMCWRPGKERYAWRCGHNGHVNDAYFEGKPLGTHPALTEARNAGFMSLSDTQRRLMLNFSKNIRVGSGLSEKELLVSIGASEPQPLVPEEDFHQRLAVDKPKPQILSSSQLLDLMQHHGNEGLLLSHDSSAYTTSPQTSLGHAIAGDSPETDTSGPETDTSGQNRFAFAMTNNKGESHYDHTGKVIKVENRNGLIVEHRSMPNFSIVGRMEEINQPNPRIWSAPACPVFTVDVIGFEFRVHPEDPRASIQIDDAAPLWATHAEIVKHVLWEVIELYGVERPPQPLKIAPGDMGDPDLAYSYSSAFTSTHRGPTEENKRKDSGWEEDPSGGDSDELKVIVQRRIITTRGDDMNGEGKSSIPWFRTPLPQDFGSENIPRFLPYAPSVVIRAVYRPVTEAVGFQTSYHSHTSGEEEQRLVNRYLSYPLLDVSILLHPDACFWLGPEEEERALAHVLNYAKKVPYALPFNLYLRVDRHRDMQVEAVEMMEAPLNSSDEKESNTDANDSSTDMKSTAPPLSGSYQDYLEACKKKREHLFDLSRFSTSSGWMLSNLTDINDDANTSRSNKYTDIPVISLDADEDSINDDTSTDNQADVRKGQEWGSDGAYVSSGVPKGKELEIGVGTSVEDILFPEMNPEGWE